MLSSVAVVLLGICYNNSLINYFLSLTASLVITPLFAYMIDVANSKMQKTQLSEKRKLFLNPLINNISATIGRSMIMWNYEDLRDRTISYANFESCIDAILDKYVICLAKLVRQRDEIRLVNESFNIKHWEEYGFREIEKQLKIILDNQINLLAEDVFSQNDIFHLNLLYDAVCKARLPYLSMTYDKNISKAAVDWPQAPLTDLDIGNLHRAFQFFVSTLKNTVAFISEFKVLETFSFNHNEPEITD